MKKDVSTCFLCKRRKLQISEWKGQPTMLWREVGLLERIIGDIGGTASTAAVLIWQILLPGAVVHLPFRALCQVYMRRVSVWI